MRALALALLFTATAADVFPRCGKRELRATSPGDACGGPSQCIGGSECATFDQSIKTPSFESAYVCTKACTSDADCESLAKGMTCTGSGHLRSDTSGPSQRLCVPANATKPEPKPVPPG